MISKQDLTVHIMILIKFERPAPSTTALAYNQYSDMTLFFITQMLLKLGASWKLGMYFTLLISCRRLIHINRVARYQNLLFVFILLYC